MQSLNFEEGYKEFCINDDESRVIRFNPADYGLLERYNEAKKAIIEAADKLQNDIELKPDGNLKDETEAAAEQLANVRKLISDQIDYIFNADVAKIAFGKQSPISTIKGKFLFERFLEVVGTVIEKEVKSEQAATEKRIKKYTSQVYRK